MYTIALYNNKGGVGKSTLTLAMADFLATLQVAGRPLRLLVIDMDGQGSICTALLGVERIEQAKLSASTIGHVALQLANGHQPLLESLLHTRSGSRGGQPPLPALTVLPSDRESMLDFDANPLRPLTLLAQRLKPLLAQHFDIALLDLPGSLDERHLLAINALIMSDAVLIPVELTRLALQALPETIRMIRYAQEKNAHSLPQPLGFILNRTDRRSRQYRLHLPQLQLLAEQNQIPCFDNHLPHAADLANASDDTLNFSSLKDRYGSYYPHVRKVVKELFDRWQKGESSP
ncbi:ParA family protein [Candidatus Magnetaquicoccus inordinatus]|uniref:ParA family protein n=1 Tax=Candidatus Magnetaquicoccus inordinatus TaxID=2496818 RepID=UPI00187D4605|nr:ParA family protein [Candidatus Magnetaquicoccus inordinatus]